MDVSHVFEEVDKFLNACKLKIEEEKEEIAESEKKLSYLRNAFSAKTPSSTVLSSLFKDEEDEGLVFSRHEEKRKKLAEQRRAEYNAYLEKKEAERLSKRRHRPEKRDVSPKSILDAVDYERVLAKRKEEEARFRDMNMAHSVSQPISNGDARNFDLNTPSTSSHVSPRTRSYSVSILNGNLSTAATVSENLNSIFSELEGRNGIEALDEKNLKVIEERITKRMEEKQRQMLKEFEKELRRNNVKEEVQSTKSSSSEKGSKKSSAKSSPQRSARSEGGYPNFGITGGGGDPIRDSDGNLLAIRGQRRRSSTDYGSILSFPSMKQKTDKEKDALYKEELRKQIEERKRSKALEAARALEEEERIDRLIEEQRRKEEEEIENEQKRLNKAKEQIQLQNERARMLEEFRKKDAETRPRRTPEVKASSPAPPPVVRERSNSPPVPTVRTHNLYAKHAETTAKVIDPEKPFSSFAKLRRTIMEDQQKPKSNLKNSYEVMNRRTVQEISDDDDDDDLYKTSTNSR